MDEQNEISLQQLKIAAKWFFIGLRWLSIIIFGVLFFVAIYFKLPAKVLWLLAIIPLVGLFVPKKIQPFIWMILSAALVYLFAWVHFPEKNSGQWRPYEFTGELNVIKNESPYTGSNAADLYKEVLEQYGETIFYFGFADSDEEQQTQMGPWNPADHPRLDFWIQTLQPALETLIRASAIDQCRFDIPHNLPSEDPQMGRLNQLKGWARILLRASWRDVHLGRQDEAIAKQLSLVGMARHLYQQNTLFDHSGAFHIELLAARSVETSIIEQIDDNGSMRAIAMAFDSVDPQWPGSWPDILAREKLQAKNLLGLFYETDGNGKVRFSHLAMTSLQEGLGYKPRRLFLNQHLMNRLTVLGLWLFLPSNPNKLSEIIDSRFDHFSRQVQKGKQIPHYPIKYIWVSGINIRSVIDWLSTQRVGYYWALDGQFIRHRAIINRITVLSALKNFYLANQKWPDHLEDLYLDDSIVVDPLNNEFFQYKKTCEGFILYSIGPNGIDDGGVSQLRGPEDDIMIWPKKPMLSDETKL